MPRAPASAPQPAHGADVRMQIAPDLPQGDRCSAPQPAQYVDRSDAQPIGYSELCNTCAEQPAHQVARPSKAGPPKAAPKPRPPKARPPEAGPPKAGPPKAGPPKARPPKAAPKPRPPELASPARHPIILQGYNRDEAFCRDPIH